MAMGVRGIVDARKCETGPIINILKARTTCKKQRNPRLRANAEYLKGEKTKSLARLARKPIPVPIRIESNSSSV